MVIENAPQEGGEQLVVQENKDVYFNAPKKVDPNPRAEELKEQFRSALEGEEAGGVAVHDFSSIPKPTELEPLPLETEKGDKPLPSAVEIAMRATDKYVENKKSAEATEDTPYFVPSKELVSFVDKLIVDGRQLRYLQWDLKDSFKTPAAWRRTLADYVDRGVLTEEEFNAAVKFIPEDKKAGLQEVIDKGLQRTGMEESTQPDPKTTETVVEAIPEAPDAPIPTPIAEASTVEAASTPESLEQDLTSKRAAFAIQYIQYRDALRTKRSKFGEMLAKLGVDRQLPREAEPEELRLARDAYLSARKVRNAELFSETETTKESLRGQIFDLKEISVTRNSRLIEDAAKERNLLDELVFNGAPEKESGKISKGLESWKNIPNYVRVEVSKRLVSGLNYTFGKMMETPATPYTGMRQRGVPGGEAPSPNKKVDGIFKKRGDISTETLNEYGKNIDAENFDYRERELLSQFENMSDPTKDSLLQKAKAKAGVVLGGTSTLVGSSKVEVKSEESQENVTSENAFLRKAGNIIEATASKASGEESGSEVTSLNLKEPADSNPEYMGITPFEIPFGTGKIQVVQGYEGDMSQVKVFFKGVMVGSGTLLGKMELSKDKAVQHEHWWSEQTEYEKAWKQIQPFLKTLQKNFK